MKKRYSKAEQHRLLNNWGDLIAEWLVRTEDPRFLKTERGFQFPFLECSADFCAMMARACEAGYSVKDWRRYLDEGGK